MAQDRMSETYLLIKQSRTGFSLLELAIVIALAAAAVAVFLAYKPVKRPSLNKSLEQINAVVRDACTQSLLNQKIYQIRFFFGDDAHLESMGSAPVEHPDRAAQETIPVAARKTITEQCRATRLVIEGNNELAKSRIRETWMLVYPEGYTQNVEIGLQSFDQKAFLDAELNPFLGVFKPQGAS